MRAMDGIRRLAAALGLSLALSGGAEAQQAARSSWDGVYAAAQADRGAAAYAANCGFCHGATLNGTGEAKALTGPEFLSNWNGLTLGDLFERIRTTMPMDKPATLSREIYADVLAYMLKFNGFPAGEAELDRRTEVLASIRIDAFKPTAAATGQAINAVEQGQTDLPNPYLADSGFFQMPTGRTMGSSSGVAVDARGHVWVADRCGANSCANSTLDPILEFDAKGRFIKAFGAGMLLFPHGLSVDAKGHVWITDQQAMPGKGAQVFKFDNTGKLLMTLGKPGVAVAGTDTFAEPTAVVVSPQGMIFVADGHSAGKGPGRIVKFAPDGQFLKAWGERGAGPEQLEVPHTLAMDTRGRLFVGDRWNDRLQIYDQEGKLLDSWTQFSRPSGVYIDAKDNLYVADSESREAIGYGHHPGWRRGVRVGSARTGKVTAFFPDTEANPEKTATSGPEGIWADRNGVIYAAQVFQKSVLRLIRKPGS